MNGTQELTRANKFKSLARQVRDMGNGLFQVTVMGGGFVCRAAVVSQFERFTAGHGWTVTLPNSEEEWTRSLDFSCLELDGKDTLYAQVLVDAVRFYYRK